MRHVSTAALAAIPSRLVVRRAWWAYVPLLVALALGCAFWATLAWFASEKPILRLILAPLTALMLVLTLLVASRIGRMLRSSHWLLRVTDGTLILNPIDAAGTSLGDLVEIPFAEILSAQRVVEKRLGVGDHSIEDVHDKHVYLDLGLAAVDASLFTAFQPPIRLQDAATLRIGWRDRTTRLTPSLDTFVRHLPVTVAHEPDARVDWQESRALSDDEIRERVRALCAGDDKIGAIKLVRVRYKMGLRQAKDFVEQQQSAS